MIDDIGSFDYAKLQIICLQVEISRSNNKNWAIELRIFALAAVYSELVLLILYGQILAQMS